MHEDGHQFTGGRLASEDSQPRLPTADIAAGGAQVSRAGGTGRGETAEHAALKRLALQWAQENGFRVCATEVRVPRSGYRADVAGFAPGGNRRTVVFECKQSRTDFLKDAHAEAATREKLVELLDRRATLESLLAVHRPDLRRGEALWPEYDTWDFSALEHDGYRTVLEQIATLQRRVLRGTKFAKMFRYRCADFLYLVVQEGIFAEAEIPAGWGLLIRGNDMLTVARKALDLSSPPTQRAELADCIGIAATRAVNHRAGFTFLPPDWTSPEMPKT